MRLTRLPVVLSAAALLSGLAGCATSIEGSGTIASDVVTDAPTASPTSDDPTSSPTPDPTTDSPTPDPTPTTNPVTTRERALCVLERAAIANVNSSFNGSKDRSGQIQILKTGAATIRGQISRSGLPAADGIRRSGQGVLDQLNRLATDAGEGNSPSTNAYNVATQKFQTACNSIS
ncbi:MAG TPA: hypothetical protein VGP36_12865 [Mycobacteriales bacterium]|jgi:hypothetical protein|nr:hypothetical protein [Mycobacteriales bacterium]